MGEGMTSTEHNIDTEQLHQLVIIGAGPAGLAAALYAAREGLAPLVLEAAVAGGMAALTERVENYPGFDEGIAGLDLVDHLTLHAKRFGANIKTGVEVTKINLSAGNLLLQTKAGILHTEAAIIATGSSYKFLGVPGETEMIGKGVHYCATCDAPLYRGKLAVVVGGGESAVQETLFIARFAAHVTIVVREKALTASPALLEQLASLRNVSVTYQMQVTQVRNDTTRVTGVRIVDTVDGSSLDLRTDAVFVFIGLTANTHAFLGAVDLDDQGFIRTQLDYMTTLPGLYAAGDVRSGSTWQIAAATGEGVAAALAVRDYLATKHYLTKKPARKQAEVQTSDRPKSSPQPEAAAKDVRAAAPHQSVQDEQSDEPKAINPNRSRGKRKRHAKASGA